MNGSPGHDDLSQEVSSGLFKKGEENPQDRSDLSQPKDKDEHPFDLLREIEYILDYLIRPG